LTGIAVLSMQNPLEGNFKQPRLESWQMARRRKINDIFDDRKIK
jgi:hypothetical protein